MIRQAELRRYKELSDTIRNLEEAKAACRTGLLAKHERDEPIEPGELTMRVSSCEQQRLTKEGIDRAMGEGTYDSLRRQIQPSTRTELRVESAENGRRRPARPNAPAALPRASYRTELPRRAPRGASPRQVSRRDAFRPVADDYADLASDNWVDQVFDEQ